MTGSLLALHCGEIGSQDNFPVKLLGRDFHDLPAHLAAGQTPVATQFHAVQLAIHRHRHRHRLIAGRAGPARHAGRDRLAPAHTSA